ncbi:MAG: PTS sugar transporter subunit IIA [Myxococcales bacterium]|nr:PTS sugar transporter subunit IIA [Myxococcales bacterium]
MRISDFLHPAAIEADLGASNKAGVLRELVGLILKVQPDLDPNHLVDTLQRREKLQSTGIGEGVAIPHGKTDAVGDVIACVGRSRGGVDFQSLDGQPTHLFFTLIVPESKHGLHLKALARVSRLLKDATVRQALLDAPDAGSLYAALLAEDEKL